MKRLIISLLSIMIIILYTGCTNNAADEPAGVINLKQTASNTQSQEPNNIPEPSEAQQLEVPYIESIPSVELFNEEYNLFYEVEFPESYTVYAAEYENAREFQLFYLNLATMDSADDVVTFVSNLLGDSDEESIQQNLDYLAEDDFVGIMGTEVDAGLFADCEISLITDEEDYEEFTGGYDVQLVVGVDPEDVNKYNELLLSNINPDSLAVVYNYMDILNYETASINVDIHSNRTQIHLGYYLENAKEIWNDMTSGMTDYYAEEYKAIRLAYGELYTDIREDLNGGFIHIFQNINDVETALKDYESTEEVLTLSSLGFMDFREDSAKCTFKNEEEGVFISISKPEWGENSNQGEINAIMFAKELENGSFIAFYYPDDAKYSIIIECDNKEADYNYYPDDNKYTNDDTGDAKELAEILFEKPDTDSILQDAWVTFDHYIKETYNMDTIDLFELNYE